MSIFQQTSGIPSLSSSGSDISRIPSLSSSVSELSGNPSLSLSGSKKFGIRSPSKSPSTIAVNAGVPFAPSPSSPPAKSKSSFASTFSASKSMKLTPAENIL